MRRRRIGDVEQHPLQLLHMGLLDGEGELQRGRRRGGADDAPARAERGRPVGFEPRAVRQRGSGQQQGSLHFQFFGG